MGAGRGCVDDAASGKETEVKYYRLDMETTSRICGGVSAVMADRPWPRYIKEEEERQKVAAATAEATEPLKLQPGTEEPAEAVEMRVGFRRNAFGVLCLSANQVRSMLAEATRARMTGETGVMRQLQALRTNLWVEPMLLRLQRPGVSSVNAEVKEPDGVVALPRTIRRPPFERSVVNVVEYLEPPVLVACVLQVSDVGRGKTLSSGQLEGLLEHASHFVGLGAHRGLQEFGRFRVVKFEPEQVEEAEKEAVESTA